jgi:hypothetical protein
MTKSVHRNGSARIAGAVVQDPDVRKRTHAPEKIVRRRSSIRSNG